MGSKKKATAVQPWSIEFFQRHKSHDPTRSVPAREFLDRCPPGVRADLLAVVKAVAEAPPPQFSGGGKWEAMHGEMKGFYEVRVTGPERRQYRLFCLLEREGTGLGRASIILITGASKPIGTRLSPREYAAVRRLGDEYRARMPRTFAR